MFKWPLSYIITATICYPHITLKEISENLRSHIWSQHNGDEKATHIVLADTRGWHHMRVTSQQSILKRKVNQTPEVFGPLLPVSPSCLAAVKSCLDLNFLVYYMSCFSPLTFITAGKTTPVKSQWSKLLNYSETQTLWDANITTILKLFHHDFLSQLMWCFLVDI